MSWLKKDLCLREDDPQVWCGSPLILGLSWEQRPGMHGSQRSAPLLGMYRRLVEVFSHGR